MQKAQILNLGAIPSRNTEDTEAPHVEGEFHRDELVEQTRSDVRRMWNLVDQQQAEHTRRTKILSAVLGALIVLFVAAVWLVYPTVRGYKGAMADIVGVRNVANGLSGRMDSVEANVGKMAAGLPALVSQLQTNVRSEMQTAKDQMNQVGQRIRADVNQKIQAVQTRLSGLESNQKEAAAHVNQLQTQLAQLNEELGTMRQQAAASAQEIQQLRSVQETGNHDLAGVNERVVTTQAAVQNLANRVERQRIDFQVSSHEKTAEVAPNIELTVKHIDAGKQEADVLLQFGNKSTDLPVRGQGVRKPVLFYSPDGNRPIELVLTQITKDGVFGFLMMPAAAAQKAAAK